MKRRIFSFALCVLMILSLCGTVIANAAVAPEYKLEKVGSEGTIDGAKYQKYKITSGERVENNNLVTVDAVSMTFDPKDGLIPMAFSGYSGTSANCAEQYRIAVEKYGYDVVGVINGSFFSMGGEGYGTYGTLVGDLISDGKIASAHAGFYGSVVAFGTDGSMNVVDSALSYDLQINGKSVPGLYYINKTSGTNEKGAAQWKDGFYYYDTSCGRVCDTSEYVKGYEVLCKKLDHTELMVGGTLKGEVVSVTANTSGGAVGEKDKLSDQFILFVKADSPNAQYVKDLKAGDSVNIAVEETLDAAKEIMEKANSVITNVGWLVKDGTDLTRQESSIGTHDVTMMARWTAFGTKEDGSYVFFTTDSVEDDATYTTGSSVCVTLRDVAKAMIGMGCTNVIRMDGGGSTAMYAKDSGSGAPGYLMYASREVGDCILVVKRSSMNKDKTAKEDLTKLVNELKDNDKASYKETVAAAKAILESKTSTSADYVRAYVALNVVTDAYKKLEVGIAAADKADKQEYAPTIWDKLTKLNEDAKKVKDDKTITADEVIALANDLNEAVANVGAISLVVSKDCPYTHGTTPDAASYPDTGNKELTDGDYSVDTDGKAPGWVGFQGGRGAKVTIDLGSVNKDLASFRCRALKITSWGISFPNSMTVEVSEDGTTFTKLGTATLTNEDKAKDAATFVLNLEKGVKARYVRFTVSGSGWTFISELEVIRNEVAYKDMGPEPEFATGDVNGDDSVDAFDYQMLKAAVLNSYEATEAELARMDVNDDQSVDAFDYQMLKAFVLGTYQF